MENVVPGFQYACGSFECDLAPALVRAVRREGRGMVVVEVVSLNSTRRPWAVGDVRPVHCSTLSEWTAWEDHLAEYRRWQERSDAEKGAALGESRRAEGRF